MFIGKSLRHDELRAGFRNCLATDRSEAQLEEARWEARRAALRFQVAAALWIGLPTKAWLRAPTYVSTHTIAAWKACTHPCTCSCSCTCTLACDLHVL